MKNKLFTRGLLVVVAIVWGVIFYRVFAALSVEDDQPVVQTAGKNEYFKMKDHAKDLVQLDLNYRDPFSHQQNAASLVTPKPVQNNQQLQKAIPKPAAYWPEIIYTGYIYNPDLKKKVAILRLNGKELMLTEGQSLNGIKLLKLAGDSVKVQYQKISKYISLK